MPLNKLPEHARPRERLMLHGSGALSLSELLAVIIGSGTRGKSAVQLSEELLQSFGSLERLLSASVTELSKAKGMGPAKALQCKAAFELSLRLARQTSPFPIIAKTWSDYANALLPFLPHTSQETLLIACLNAKGHIIHVEISMKGTVSSVLIHPREVFAVAVQHAASSIIVAHNHPSGDPTPSKADRDATTLLYQAGQTMQIPLSEHIIFGRDQYYLIRNNCYHKLI